MGSHQTPAFTVRYSKPLGRRHLFASILRAYAFMIVGRALAI